MADASRSAPRVRFGDYEADLEAGELRKHGLKIKIPDQPFQLLSVLLERPGEVVTREELQKRLWASDTFVDFEHGLNKAINRLRDALRDSPDKPRFIETLPKRGYRFIAALDTAAKPVAPETPPVPEIRLMSAVPGPLTSESRPSSRKLLLVLVAPLLVVAVFVLLYRRQPPPQQAFRSSLVPPPDSAFLPRNFAFSPDGTHLAFSALSADGKIGLWLRTLSTSRAHRLDETDGATYPFWSPDGKHVGFFAEGKLKTVDLASGAVTPLADTPIASGGTSNRDGVIVFSAGIGRAALPGFGRGRPGLSSHAHSAGSNGPHLLVALLPSGR